jgi:ABC-type multidrug transport system ATPase subunit
VPESTDEDLVLLKGQMDVDRLSVATEKGKTLLKETTFSLKPGQHMALVGGSGSGKSTLLHCLMGLYPQYEGRYELDGKSASALGRRNLSANIGSVFQSPAIFSGSIEENLLYGCKAVIGASAEAGEEKMPDLNARIEVLQQTGFFVDVLGFGLSSRFHPSPDERIRKSVLEVRAEFHEKYAEETAADVEAYDDNRFLHQATIAENLLFGSPVEKHFYEDKLSGNPLFIKLLKQQKLMEPLTELGARFFDRILDRYGNQTVLPANLPLRLEEMESLRQAMKKPETGAIAVLPERQRLRLLGLALRMIPAVHDLIEIPESLTRRIVDARKANKEKLEEEASGAVCFFRPDAYIAGATVVENILFGRITSESTRAKNRIHTLINRLLVEEELLEAILEVGMQFQVGRGGENLSGGQRQKLALARAFLKKPPILLLDEATASLDNQSQERVQNALDSRWKGRSTLVASVHRLDIIENYDKIAVLQSGRIEEMGGFDELMSKKGLLHRLVQRRS